MISSSNGFSFECEAEDCSVDYANFQRSWSAEKKYWCCKREGRGCKQYQCDGDVPLAAL